MRRFSAPLMRPVVGLVGCVLAGFLSSGCLLSSPATITATAWFNDVGNLVSGAPVELAGITIGSVQSITLSGSRAKVVLSIDKSAHVPADVKAEAQQSTVLGQEVVELVAPSSKSGSGSASSSGTLLANGAVIHSTYLVPGIQQFVAGGTAVLGAIGTSQLASLVNAGGEGFGGQALTLRHLIAHLNTMMAGYSSRDSEIKTLVASMNQLNGSLAPNARADAEALSNLSRTVAILNHQSQNFLHLLRGLDHLSIQGHSLMTQEMSQIDFQLTGLAGVTGTLNSEQGAIAELLAQLPGHDMVLHDTTVNRFSQIIDSLIVCGLPDGGSSSQAASNCYGAGGNPPALPSSSGVKP
jgi:phospholipid/cholesterol/gamma-HCH transport system substrate-binding protein